MNTPQDEIRAWAAREARPIESVCSIDQIHASLSLAVRDERRVEASIAEVRERDGTLWLGLTQVMAEGRTVRSLSGRVDRSAREALDGLAAGTFDSSYLGWTIMADLRLGLAPDARVKATVTDVLQLRPSPTQEAAASALRQLREEGYLTAQRLLSEPRQVRSIAVICPAASAGQADVAQVLGRLFGDWMVEVVWLPAQFEGRACEASLLAGVSAAAKLSFEGVIDVVLIVRGGGAPAALAYLDSPDLARAVAGLRVPVITGIGHADNRTLLDEVAWYAAATPSDAAQRVIRLRAAAERPVPADLPLAKAERPSQSTPAPRSEPAALGPVAAQVIHLPQVLAQAVPKAEPDAQLAPWEDPVQVAELAAALTARPPAPPASDPRVFVASTHDRVLTAQQASAAGTLVLAFDDGELKVSAVA